MMTETQAKYQAQQIRDNQVGGDPRFGPANKTGMEMLIDKADRNRDRLLCISNSLGETVTRLLGEPLPVPADPNVAAPCMSGDVGRLARVLVDTDSVLDCLNDHVKRLQAGL